MFNGVAGLHSLEYTLGCESLYKNLLIFVEALLISFHIRLNTYNYDMENMFFLKLAHRNNIKLTAVHRKLNTWTILSSKTC